MSQLTNLEVEELRHLIMDEQLSMEKANLFVQQVNDPQLRNYLEKKITSSQQNTQSLSQFLMS
ncbi:MAG: hypothetical protein ACOCRO_10020 [Halanaerobiales bacterium]